MVEIDTDFVTDWSFAPELAVRLKEHVGNLQRPGEAHHIEWLRDNIISVVKNKLQCLNFLQMAVLNAQARKDIAMAFFYSYAVCVSEVILRPCDERDSQYIRDLWEDNCKHYMGSVYCSLKWDSKSKLERNQIGMALCFEELLSYCHPKLVPLAKRAFVPEEHEAFMRDWLLGY